MLTECNVKVLSLDVYIDDLFLASGFYLSNEVGLFHEDPVSIDTSKSYKLYVRYSTFTGSEDLPVQAAKFISFQICANVVFEQRLTDQYVVSSAAP